MSTASWWKTKSAFAVDAAAATAVADAAADAVLSVCWTPNVRNP